MQFAAQRVLHELTVQRLVQRVYEQRIIGNVERGTYVECMLELALRERHPAWRLTEPWATWDLENRRTGARIEVKQSAALQRWHERACPHCGSLNEWKTCRPGSPKPSFDIKPTKGYASANGATWNETARQRCADLYVFAWHPEEDPDIADHRRSDQWTFLVVAEQRLPQETPLAKTIGVKALTQLTIDSCDDDGLAETCDFDALATTVVRAVQVLESRRSLRAQQPATGV